MAVLSPSPDRGPMAALSPSPDPLQNCISSASGSGVKTA